MNYRVKKKSKQRKEQNRPEKKKKRRGTLFTFRSCSSFSISLYSALFLAPTSRYTHESSPSTHCTTRKLIPTTQKLITRHTHIRYLTCDVYCIHITIEFIQDNCKINCFTIIHKVTRCTHSCLTHKTTLSIWKPGSTYRWHEVTKEIFIVQARGQNLNYNVQWGRINKHETCKTSSFSSSKQFGIYSITKNSHKFVPAG